MQKVTSQTIEWLRFPLIAAVVLLHSGENGVTGSDFYSTLCILLSHGVCKIAVPCFFLISGYLFFGKLEAWDKGIWKGKILTRVRTLLVPFIILNLIAFVAFFLYGMLRGSINGNEAVTVVEALNHYGWVNMFWGCTCGCPIDYPLWFLRNLIIFVAFTPAIHYFCNKCRLPEIVIMFLAFWLCRSRDLEGMFFFTLGSWMRIAGKDPVEFFNRQKWLSYILSAILLAAIVITYRGNHQAYEFIKYAFVAAGVGATFCLVSSLVESGTFKPIPWLASASFFVYCSHAVLILHDISNYIVLHLLPDTVFMVCVGLFLRAIIAICICLCLYWAMSKAMPKTLAVLTGGRQ